VKVVLALLRWLPLTLFTTAVVWSFTGEALPALLIWATIFALFFEIGFLAVRKGLVRFVIRRTSEAIMTLWVIATLTFTLLRIVPGGPFDAEKALPPEIKANIEAKYHLHDPILKQYGDYLIGIVHGDLGESYKYVGRPISTIIAESLPNSIQLGIYALVLAYLIGIPLGVLAAARHETWVDSTLMMIAMSGVALPSFLVAPLFIIVFCFWLNWLEPALWMGPTFYILPTVVLGIRPAATIARLTRASVLEVIRSDFVRTARAKGLEQSQVLFKHVLRNSLIPVLTLTGPLVAGVLTGSFVIEQIFAINGSAKHLIQSVTNRDYPLILGMTLLFSALLVLANLITDLLIAAVDPRVKMS
jgi:oligopeptide transport system permease protein